MQMLRVLAFIRLVITSIFTLYITVESALLGQPFYWSILPGTESRQYVRVQNNNGYQIFGFIGPVNSEPRVDTSKM